MRPGASGAGASGPPVPVVTAPARNERVARELKALGTAVANESVEVTSKASNLVTSIRFRDGQSVKRGQVLVQLDSAQARADLAVANAALYESTSQFDRSRELVSTNVLSQQQYDQIEAALKANQARVDAARAKLDETVIRAPFAGRVGLRRVSVGTLVNPGDSITSLDDTSVMKVDFTVPETFISGLREGQQLSATTSVWPGKVFRGKVSSVDSRVDATTRAIVVRAKVPNDDGLLRPGMFLNVTLTNEARDALVIPEEALVPEQSRQFVYVVEDGRAARREVQIGRREPGKVEIIAGLKDGDRVVIEGTQKVREGGAVRDLATEGEA